MVTPGKQIGMVELVGAHRWSSVAELEAGVLEFDVEQ